MAEYSRGILRLVVAQICQIIGWHSINSTSLEFMVDLMQEYLLRISRITHQYAEILGRTDVNLDDVGLAFQQMNIDLHQLCEYVKNVDSLPCAIAVPKLSIYHDNHLNFLKPGSREVVTRSVYIHEHLPAMNPETFSDEVDESCIRENTVVSNVIDSIQYEAGTVTKSMSTEAIFKRPGDPISEQLCSGKRTKVADENRPLREIHSVIMTTSGFLSPAREGKLPESRTPAHACIDSPPLSYSTVPLVLKSEKKIKKIVKKNVEDRKFDKENKKKNREKELFKPDKVDDLKTKKLASAKETVKFKPSKASASKALLIIPPSSATCTSPQHLQNQELSEKIYKKNSPKLKSEKVTSGTTNVYSDRKECKISGKLPVEPDKQKLNIFKKLSKPREDKGSDLLEHHKLKEIEFITGPPELILNDADHKLADSAAEVDGYNMKVPRTLEEDNLSNTELVELQSPSSDVYMFDDMSPPGTPSTPKTPELNVPGSTNNQKKRKKDKRLPKKDNMKSIISRDNIIKSKNASETTDTDLLGRPKTPDASETSFRKDSKITPTLSFPFFPAFPSAPGLIPHPIQHPMFSRFPLPLARGLPNQQSFLQNLPLPPRFLPPTSNIGGVSPIKERLSDQQCSLITDSDTSLCKEASKAEAEKLIKNNKTGQQIEKIHSPQQIETPCNQFEMFGSNVPTNLQQVQPSQKIIKLEKNDKKSKKHKVEKKEKLKKKKEKKDKHKEKIEKNREKKERLEKLMKMKDRRERKDKRKDKDTEEKESEAVPKITLKFGTTSSSPPMTETNLMKKITIKPLVKKVDDNTRRESSPELAKISALVTRPPKQKHTRIKHDTAVKKNDSRDEKAVGDRSVTETSLIILDQGGHQVWICPACGNQDDGSPMIGCDDCDAWYHWVCVGMQVPPATNEDWYCRLCISKKQGLQHDKKKKKRKKKVKVTS